MCPIDPRGCQKVRDDIQGLLNRRELTIASKDDEVCVITPGFNIPMRVEVTFNSQKLVVAPLVICFPGPMPYASEKAIPYKYKATMLENGCEVLIPSLPSVVNIAEDSRVLRNGCVIPAVFPKKASAPVIKQVQSKDSSATKDLASPVGPIPILTLRR